MENLREQYGITCPQGSPTPIVDKPRESKSEGNLALDKAGIQLNQSRVGSILGPAVEM